MSDTFILLVIGLAAGLLSGMLGIGGGILIIPMLVGFLGFSQQHAQGTSLALLLPPIGILAVINYYNKGFVDIRAAAIMCATFLVGSYFSSKLAVNLPAEVIKKVFAGFLVIYGLKVLIWK